MNKKFKSIESNIDRIRETIEHIKTFSRDQDMPSLDKISVNKIIHKALSLVRAQYNNP